MLKNGESSVNGDPVGPWRIPPFPGLLAENCLPEAHASTSEAPAMFSVSYLILFVSFCF